MVSLPLSLRLENGSEGMTTCPLIPVPPSLSQKPSPGQLFSHDLQTDMVTDPSSQPGHLDGTWLQQILSRCYEGWKHSMQSDCHGPTKCTPHEWPRCTEPSGVKDAAHGRSNHDGMMLGSLMTVLSESRANALKCLGRQG